MRTQLVRAALLTAGSLLVLGAWAALGRRATESLRDSERASFRFADVECNPPDFLSRADFLGEVQYQSGLPDRLSLADDGLATRLATAFAAHALVETVARIEVLPRRVRADLVYRTPALAVPGTDAMRVVDGKGVLLPLRVPAQGLPYLADLPAVPPAGAAGTPWGDERVAAAARVAACLRPQRDRVAVDKIAFEGDQLVLLMGTARVLWGSRPGREARGEPDAATKALRLRELVVRDGHLPDSDLDLSAPARQP
jgi:hypothetical protein